MALYRPRASIREAVLHKGVPDTEVLQEIAKGIFPITAQAYEGFRRLLGRPSSTAEWEFVRDLADCTSWGDVEISYSLYESQTERSGLLRRLVGGVPNLSRVRRFYEKLKHEGAANRSPYR